MVELERGFLSLHIGSIEQKRTDDGRGEYRKSMRRFFLASFGE